MYKVYRLLDRKGECLTILEISIKLASEENPFGQVTDGFLRVRGRLDVATWAWPSHHSNWAEDTSMAIANYVPPFRSISSVQNPMRFEVCPSEDKPSLIYLDDVTKDPVSQQAFFLPVYVQSTKYTSQLEGLLLLPLPCGRFVRIGKMSIGDGRVEEILNCLMERELTII
jgi:hypothetical protein